jgi:hypothetical protein
MTDAASDAGPTQELDDLRARQQAVANVLVAMTQAGLRLQPILEEIIANAARLRRAEQAFIWLWDGDVLRARSTLTGRERRAWSAGWL